MTHADAVETAANAVLERVARGDTLTLRLVADVLRETNNRARPTAVLFEVTGKLSSPVHRAARLAVE